MKIENKMTELAFSSEDKARVMICFIETCGKVAVTCIPTYLLFKVISKGIDKGCSWVAEAINAIAKNLKK